MTEAAVKTVKEEALIVVMQQTWRVKGGKQREEETCRSTCY